MDFSGQKTTNSEAIPVTAGERVVAIRLLSSNAFGM